MKLRRLIIMATVAAICGGLSSAGAWSRATQRRLAETTATGDRAPSWTLAYWQEPPLAPPTTGDLEELEPEPLGEAAGGSLLAALQSALNVRTDSRYCGAQSCMATACHGQAPINPVPNPYQGGEYFHWLENDPHARASLTLQQPRSRQMLRLLKIADDQGRIVDAKGYDNCRRCHDLAAEPSEQFGGIALGQGVSCEACHGPAEHWRDKHQVAGWREVNDAASLGFINTDDLSVRAAACAQCHVGGADRQVNHDMIAAGHPPLFFDYASYYRRLPKHWDDRRSTSANERHFELLQWAVGQYASARAASMQLASRSQTKQVWPELAEYRCFSCHHDLMGHDAWPKASPGLGIMTPSPWYGALLSVAVKPCLDQVAADCVEEALAWRGQVLKAAGQGVEHGGEASTAKWPLRPRFLPAEQMRTQVLSRLSEIVAEDSTAYDWELAVQVFLVLDAMGRDLERAGSGASADVRQWLEQMRRTLRFPTDYDSPRLPGPGGDANDNADADAGAFESLPDRGSPQELRQWMQQTIQALLANQP